MRRNGLTRSLRSLLFLALMGTSCSDDDGSSTSSEPATTQTSPSTAAPDTTSTASDPTDPAPTDPAAPSVETTAVPPDTAAPPGEWPVPGADYDNSRTATGSSITTDNVADLTVMWTAELPDAGSMPTTPIVLDDVVYVEGGRGSIAAVSLADGSVRWTTPQSGPNIGPTGVAVADGVVFGLSGPDSVQAVDAATGDQLWVTTITDTPTTGVDIQPQVADGLVLVSTVPVSLSGIYTGGDRGIVKALDAATGEVVWEFDTVLGDDLWGNPEVNSGGGAWYPPAVDLEAGIVYIGVANPAPFPGTPEFPNGSSRPGDNLYTDSLVALDLHSGELLWYHQVIPHDILDRDQVHALIARLPNGEPVIVSAGKSGIVVGIDPGTGDPLWRTEVGIHQNDDLDELDGPTEVYPGTFGGVITPPATADGVVYLATLNAPTLLPPDQPSYFGSELGSGPGEVAAVDAETGEVLWSTEVPGDPLGAATVVNDLVFTTVLSGELIALDRATGEIVWQFTLPGGTNGWMAVAGDTLIVPVGNANPPRLVALALPSSG